MAVGAAILFLASSIASGSKQLSPDEMARIGLIRGLAHEVAVTKVAMPRGKRGLTVNAQGQLEQGKADAEMRENGVAIRPGMPVTITKVQFKSNRVILELNGGAKKKKWYQHIEIGVGPMTQPIAPETPTVSYGSLVSLAYEGKEADLTVPKVKALLASVLDFNRHSPTVLYSPAVSPEIKEAIKKHEVIVGMDRDAVLSAKGAPDRRVREDRAGVEQEDWIYGLPPHVLFVTFDGEKVVKVTQY
ncbi:MAG: hypothetical protein LAN62_19130 [Acidobacteriia bacterium]|nr:hypothetical protein [Terriglobia bacterium]